MQNEDTNHAQEQATVLGRVRRLLSVQEPRDPHTRPSFKRHSSDVFNFVSFVPEHHFQARPEEIMQTHSKLNSHARVYHLSTVNEMNTTPPSPDASTRNPFPNNRRSGVVSEPRLEDMSDSDSFVQESLLGQSKVQEHGEKEVYTAQGTSDTESRRIGRFSPGDRKKRNQRSVQLWKDSSISSTTSLPSPKDAPRREDQQQDTLQLESTCLQQTVRSSSQEKDQRQNHDS